MTTMSELSVFDGNRPTRAGDLTLETAGMVPIPEDARYGANWRNFTVWFAPNMELSGVFTGTLAATLGLGLWAGLAAILIGVVLGALPVAGLALWGPRTGMAQLPLARLPFGKSITVPALVQWLSAVAWDALVGLFGGEAAQLLLHVPFAVGVLVVLSSRPGEPGSSPGSSRSSPTRSSSAATFLCTERSTAGRRSQRSSSW
jgi:NCS1 family nucleobase:cation symporter-1